MKKQSNKFAKRLLCFLLVAVMVISCVPVQAHAAQEKASERIEISVGETKTLKSSGFFSKTTWKSSDTDVVTVSNKGVITGVSVGTATVTGTTKSLFSWFAGGTTVKTYEVSVTNGQEEEPDVPVVPDEPTTEAPKPDQPEQSEVTTIKAGETVTFSVKEKGTTTWKSSNTKVVTVTNKGVATGVGEGTAAITATTKSGGFNFFGFSWGGKTTITKFEIRVVANENVDPEPDVPSTEEPENSEKENYDVTFNANGDAVTGIPDKQIIKRGEKAYRPDEVPTREGYEFAGWYLLEEVDSLKEDFDFENTQIQKDIVLYAGWISLNDTDKDGLVDGLENYYGTDINNQDSDNDSLSDYVEVVLLGTNPLATETEGVKDTDIDSDGDGISNIEEMNNGTNPGDDDTDADLLTDEEEIDLGTDPANYDTDSDGVSDGLEVKMSTNPLVAEDEFNITKTTDAKDSVTPFVDITLRGEQVDTLAVNPITDTKLFPEDMPGYLGKAYDFSVDGEFDEAVISFEFDSTILEDGVEPAIFYFNENEQSLEELDTTIEGNVASAVVEHFSTYILIDRVVYHNAFKWEDEWDTEGEFYSVEIVLVVDDSGSMDWNDENNQRLSVAQRLIDKLPEYSKVGIVKFENYTTLLTDKLTDDRELAKSYLTTDYFYASGGTYMYEAINESFALFKSTDETTLKMMVVLSDGDASDTGLHSSTIEAAVNNNVRIYTVGLGDSTSYFTNYLEPLASGTNGEFYLASNADELADIYDDINKKIDLESHSDDDGIPDYYEDNMVAFNGTKIAMDKYSDDTDGDGLADNKEVEVELVRKDGKIYVKGILHSYPDKIDSDMDSIEDYYDPKPMSYTITDRTISFVEGLSYTNLNNHVGKTVRQAIADGASLDGISDEYVKYLNDAVIVHANGSGYYVNWFEFFDRGLASIALQFNRPGERTAVVYALRGTEPDDDLLNDVNADVKLGTGWDSIQSRKAFSEYKKIATNKNYDYYVTGHSLGGRLAQDVIYKTYNANEGFLETWNKKDIITPVHSVTFNGLGYNAIVYATLENDVLAEYKNKLTNYYFELDAIGQSLGCSGVFKRAGKDILLECKEIIEIDKNKGKFEGKRRREELDGPVLPDIKHHGIKFFHEDYDLLYQAPHSFSYWVD